MKFLRNQAIVVILALAAVGLVSKNVILPLFHTVQPLSHVESDDEIDQQDEYMTEKPVPMTDFDTLEWAIDYVRDPFKMVEAETESIEKTETPVVPAEEKPLRYDVLVAVVQEPGKSLAVINDVIVGEGDYYEEFRVIKIGPDSVELEGPDGTKTLEF